MAIRNRFWIAASLIAGSASAISPCWAQQWYPNLTPTEVIAVNYAGYLSSALQIITAEAIVNPAHCATTDFYILSGDTTSVLAIVLAAIQSNKHIRIVVADNACDYGTGRPLVTAVGIM